MSSLDHWTTREVPLFDFDSNSYIRAWVFDVSYAWKLVLRVFSWHGSTALMWFKMAVFLLHYNPSQYLYELFSDLSQVQK